MILVADSGSTSTQWGSTSGGALISTAGLNPHYSSDADFRAALAAVVQALGGERPAEVYFYGAGCAHAAQRARVEALLAEAFGQQAALSVEGDLLGACRATAGCQPALVAILGTGSNACFYDGRRIAIQAPSLGYLLGDSGSANHVGRLLLADALGGFMPPHVAALFAQQHPLSLDEALNRLYHRPHAARFLASLAPFATANIAEPYCAALVGRALTEWYSRLIAPVAAAAMQQGAVAADLRLHVVGSFGAAVAGQLRTLCAERGIEVGSIVASPFEGLRRFHSHSFAAVRQ